MIEVNRGSYLEESTGDKFEQFVEVASIIQSLMSRLMEASDVRS